MSIASEISRLQAAKADLKTAIEGKGVTVSSSATLDDYADLVDSISTGGGGTGTEVTISTAYTDPISLFQALVPNPSANTVYTLSPVSLSSPTQNNQLLALHVGTDGSGNVSTASGGEAFRYKNSSIIGIPYSNSYAIAVTVGDKYLLVEYGIT